MKRGIHIVIGLLMVAGILVLGGTELDLSFIALCCAIGLLVRAGRPFWHVAWLSMICFLGIPTLLIAGFIVFLWVRA